MAPAALDADHGHPCGGYAGAGEQLTELLGLAQDALTEANDHDDFIDMSGERERVDHLGQRGRINDHEVRSHRRPIDQLPRHRQGDQLSHGRARDISQQQLEARVTVIRNQRVFE